ncbi:WUSCHEL related homeobox 13 [Euphorbia peplus]|nr:WUSCHEL related homeobox 13 [Euphorbia peplus]
MEDEHKIQSEKGLIGAHLGVKVMTDEQLEILRKQICVYVAISESLVQMHKSLSSQPDFSGMRVPSPYNGQFLSYSFHKIPSRQRWAPKQAQLQILESIFEENNATPGRQRIKEITSELKIHGPITETNVYNWFQNRRARTKRKQQGSCLAANDHNNNNGESEVGIETSSEFGKDKKSKFDENNDAHQLDENLELMVKHMYYQSPEMGGIDQLIGKTEDPLSYNGVWHRE